MLPILLVIAGVVAASVAAAVTYFFTSNNAARKLREYKEQVQRVLDLLGQKLELLKKKYAESQEENEELRVELERTKKELEELQREYDRWNSAQTADEGALAIAQSFVLRSVNFDPEEAMKRLEEREKAVLLEVSQLTTSG